MGSLIKFPVITFVLCNLVQLMLFISCFCCYWSGEIRANFYSFFRPNIVYSNYLLHGMFQEVSTHIISLELMYSIMAYKITNIY
jgi:hypothetical protein